MKCYFNCNVSAIYSHTCSCPNNCYQDRNQGKCENSQCNCEKGWKGKDCSIVDCPHNICSNNGKCINGFCKCLPNSTGQDCSSPIVPRNSLPYGIVFPNEKYWYVDEYKDAHPVLNISVAASIFLYVDQKEFVKILQPENIYDESFIKGDMIFNNGNIFERMRDVALRVKGKASRERFQKQWVIAFDKYQHKKRRFYGLERLGFKSWHDNMRYCLSFEIMRSLGLKSQRCAYANLFINDVHFGHYYMGEEITKEFIKRRYPSDKGNMYKMTRGHIIIEGDGSPYYYMIAHRYAYRRYWFRYLQTFGDLIYDDLARFVMILNNSTSPDLIKNLPQVFNVENYLRSSLIELFVTKGDGYTFNGNNYYLYRDGNRLDFIHFDFDESWLHGRMRERYDDWGKVNIYEWGQHGVGARNITSVLTRKIIEHFKPRYTEIWKLFLSTILENKGEKVKKRIEEIQKFLIPMAERDYIWKTLNGNRNVNSMLNLHQRIVDYIENRYNNATQQLE